MAKQCMLAVIQVMHHRWEIAAGCSTYGTRPLRAGWKTLGGLWGK